ncbi:MAG TPA: fumarylacetoacetate hydrolase family protein, partial [Microbacterium sp.]|nr:fumarylacetoacetate hydrolase family protein [Microbacterium sp.]
MTDPIARPGKIIAIHLSYASRAEQRGRRPAHPSYFFKPASSVAASGGTVERPAGTELLAFEGEIALVIGKPARRVSLADAWAHVAWVTAANDLGLYDLRANDKGSNVRSKGGDGYTPLGPQLIDARTVDPAALRVRAWVNGELRQDDTTAGLLFPLAQLVADLSQHFTLETGDVILTGTPAGSSVVVPGDVVEIEVDAAGATSGRLITTVVQGDVPFDPELGSMPSVDDVQRAEAWGERSPRSSPRSLSEDGAHSPRSLSEDGARSPRSLSEDGGADRVETRSMPISSDPVSSRFARSTNEENEKSSLSPALRAKLEAAPTAGLSTQLRKRGITACFIDGVTPNIAGAKIVGTAKTLRFVPFREDLFASHGGGYNAQKRAFDAVSEGEIIVIEARGDASTGTLGDIMALRAQTRGAAGVVTD